MPPRRIGAYLLWLVAALVFAAGPVHALDEGALRKLATGELDEKLEAVDTLARTPDPRALEVFQALLDGTLLVDAQGRLFIKAGGRFTDAASGSALPAPVPEPDAVLINNRLRVQLQAAIASLQLFSPDRAVRLTAAKGLSNRADADILPVLEQAVAKETDAEVLALLEPVLGALRVVSPDPKVRLAAAKSLGASGKAETRTLLARLLEKNLDGTFAEPDADVRAAAAESLDKVERRLATSEWIARIFAGLSLGSILMLAAIGLAITYGLLGVINMAHGEMIMIGAYATYVTQGVFQTHFPGALAWYPVAALPVAFFAAAAVGVLLERTVIRFLYGRPLETLLATWGISLFLIQLVRQIFGPQNVEIANPSWLSGSIVVAGATLPLNRIVIIGFALAVVLLVAASLARTRLGLFVRALTQNRSMAACVGVPTARIDMLAFGLGSGIAGLAGLALSQVGNVGPDLGQSYIIDSFMVVVLGGVGQVAGTVLAGFGLGVLSKLLEPHTGAVIAKITILVIIIAFIQKRPQGIFALKGRAVDA